MCHDSSAINLAHQNPIFACLCNPFSLFLDLLHAFHVVDEKAFMLIIRLLPETISSQNGQSPYSVIFL